MVNVIIFNNGKYTAQMSYDSGLTTVMDMTSSDNMRTDIFFCPAFITRLTESRSFWVPSFVYLVVHLFSLLGCKYFPREIPLHLELEISQSSMIHPLAQWGPIIPSCNAVGGAHLVAALHTVNPLSVI